MLSAPHRHDQAHWTRVNVGMTSPLWLPFLTAAAAGAAWWTYANWSRSLWAGASPRRDEPPLQPHAAPWKEPERSGSGSSGPSSAAERATPTTSEQPPATEESADRADVIDAAYAANLGPVPKPARKTQKTSARKPR